MVLRSNLEGFAFDEICWVIRMNFDFLFSYLCKSR